MGEEEKFKIKPLTTDESLKTLGELLSNESSRRIIKALIDCEMYVNEIAKKLDLRSNLIVHHLRKMESIGLLEITYKRITKKGIEHRFFRIPKGLLVLPNAQKEDKDRLFKRIQGGVKFVAIIVSALIPLALQVAIVPSESKDDLDSDHGITFSDALVMSLIIIIIGLVIERIYIHRGKK